MINSITNTHLTEWVTFRANLRHIYIRQIRTELNTNFPFIKLQLRISAYTLKNNIGNHEKLFSYQKSSSNEIIKDSRVPLGFWALWAFLVFLPS